MVHKFFITGLVILCLVSCKTERIWEEFEDPVFIALLHDNYDIPITEKGRIDLDDDNTRQALANIKYLNIDKKKCISLSGINNFPSLEYLSCRNNRITSLDVSYLRNLRYLICSQNYLKHIYLNPNLETLICSYNQINNLKIKECTNMQWIDCRNNRLKELDLRGCNKLSVLSCTPQTDNESNTKELTVFMHPDLKKKWEKWEKENPNAKAIFKE